MLGATKVSHDHLMWLEKSYAGVAGKDEEKVIMQQPVTAHGNIEDGSANYLGLGKQT